MVQDRVPRRTPSTREDWNPGINARSLLTFRGMILRHTSRFPKGPVGRPYSTLAIRSLTHRSLAFPPAPSPSHSSLTLLPDITIQ